LDGSAYKAIVEEPLTFDVLKEKEAGAKEMLTYTGAVGLKGIQIQLFFPKK